MEQTRRGRGMGIPAVGSIVLVPIPFTDFSGYKKRPALVVGYAEFNNIIVCQITSKAYTSKQSIALTKSDYKKGELRLTSYIRPDKLSTIDTKLILANLAELTLKKQNEVSKALVALFEIQPKIT